MLKWHSEDEGLSGIPCLGPTIRFLLEKVNALGGNVNGKHFRCCFCAENLGGGFDRQNGIMLCANKLISQRHQEQVMAHGE